MAEIMIVRADVKPEHFAEARRALHAMVAPTRAEDGCETYVVHTAADGAPTLYLYERWRDRAAVDAHLAQDHTRALFASFETWLSAPVAITMLQDIA